MILIVDVAAELGVEEAVELEAAPLHAVRDSIVETRVAAADLDDGLLARRVEENDRHAPRVVHAIARDSRAPAGRRMCRAAAVAVVPMAAVADGDDQAVIVHLEP